MSKILVIDNDKLTRWSLNELFSQEGYGVDTVATVEGAISLMRETSYDLICADPEINRDNAVEMLDTINQFQPGAKIIILSTLSGNQTDHYLKTLRVFSIIEKPFKSDHMKSVAREALELGKREV